MLLKAEPYIIQEVERMKQIVAGLETSPHLVIVRVGDDMASGVYIRNKIKMCDEIGIRSTVLEYKSDITTEELMINIERYINNDPDVAGCIVQLPLPKHINARMVLDTIDPVKDVDGLGSQQIGWMHTGDNRALYPCTPKGIVDLMKFYDIQIKGQNVGIINASEIVGKPLAELILKEKGTPTICHTGTRDVKEVLKHSDIVVTAIGHAGYFRYYDFNPGTTIIDVSMNRNSEGKLCGDVEKRDYDILMEMGCNLTPVPGGVGRTTVLTLMKNVLGGNYGF